MFIKITRYIITVFLLLFILTCHSGCSNSAEPVESNIYFSTSFEKETDLANYTGYGAFERREDAPPGSGKYSLFVSGGCVAPHCLYEFPPLESPGKFIIQLQGKALLNTGGVILSENSGSPNAISVFVDRTEWVQYESRDTLVCEAGARVVLEFMSGGFVPGAMLVDDINIIIVD
jgi:hypothetical protein